MSMRKPGVNIDDLRLDPKSAIARAAQMGFAGIEFGAAIGDLQPRALGDAARRHLSHLVRGRGLDILAVTADPPGARWTDPKSVNKRVECACEVIDLARSLKASVVSARTGSLTHPETGDPSPIAIEALARVGERADSRGVTFAICPANERTDRVSRVLAELRCPAIAVAFDPAALIMAGLNPMSYLEVFAQRISLVYLRDATVGGAEQSGSETLLGKGDVDWEGVLAVLEAADHSSPFIARCVSLANPSEVLPNAIRVFAALTG